MRGKDVFVGLVLMVAIGISGCASTSTSGSRVEYYSDLTGLAADSAAVVIGTVQSQTVTSDLGTPDTVSAFDVEQVVWADGAATPSTGGSIEIRQLGADGSAEVPSPILEPGQRYALFITPSGLDGALAEQFYISGGGAGTYAVAEDTLTRVSTDPGDSIPGQLTISELSGFLP